MDISFKLPEQRRFNMRVAGILITEDNELLIHRDRADDFWTLPGGRCQFQEQLHDALQRELWEELGMEKLPVELVWFFENFFAYRNEQFHELSYFYKSRVITKEEQRFISHFVETQHGFDFRWVPVPQLDNYIMKPDIILPKIMASDYAYCHEVVDERC